MCLCCGPNIFDAYEHVVMYQTKHRKHTRTQTHMLPVYFDQNYDSVKNIMNQRIIQYIHMQSSEATFTV